MVTRPLALAASFAVLLGAGSGFADFTPTKTPELNGTRATVDLPKSQHHKNVGGSDGAGLCVFTSIWHSAIWQNIVDLDGYREWMRRQPGGGWPEKVSQTLATYCREKGVPVPEYVQTTDGDESFLEVALKTGRCPCVTYAGRDDFYRGPIAHMVNLVYLDSARAAILDNNRPGVTVWMTRKEFIDRWNAMNGGWAIVFLASPPPPYSISPATLSHRSACDCGGVGQCDCGEDCECGKPATVYGQCPGGRCYPLSTPLSSQPGTVRPATYYAVPAGAELVPNTGGNWYRFPGSRVIYCTGPIAGAYDPEARQFAIYDGVAHSDWGPIPVGLAIPEPVSFGEPLTGVVSDKIKSGAAYSHTGRPCSRYEAITAILADDSDRWHLAAVGSQAFLDRVSRDVSQLPPEIKNKLHVQLYDPSAWQVSQFGLPVGLVLRKPTGNRVSADVGAVAEKDYSADRLLDLIGRPAGPSPRPILPILDVDKYKQLAKWLAIGTIAVLLIRKRA